MVRLQVWKFEKIENSFIEIIPRFTLTKSSRTYQDPNYRI